MCYLGDLDRIFASAAAAVRIDGLFAFTTEALNEGEADIPEDTGDSDEGESWGEPVTEVESGEGADWRIDSSGRYRHRKIYLQRLAQASGFSVRTYKRVVVRRRHSSADADPVFAHLFVLLRNSD